MRCCLVCGAVLTALGVSMAADPPAVPRGPAPVFLTAQVTGTDADQVVFMKPMFSTRMVMKDGKQFPTQVASCVPVTVRLDGKAVRAFGTDGKVLEAVEVGKRLAKSAPVVVFHVDEPDPYYIQFLREGTVVFVAPRELFDPRGVAPAGPPSAPKK